MSEIKDEKELTRKLSPTRILIPVLIGLLAASYLVYNALTDVRFEQVINEECGNYNWVDGNNNGIIDYGLAEDFEKAAADCEGEYQKITYQDVLAGINWGVTSTVWMFLALVAMALRDVGYMIRIRELTDRMLNWWQSFRVIMLWEFASALTPSIVGGSGIAIFILNREKIPLGKSTALVMMTAMLDEIFYITMVIFILLTVSNADLFPIELQQEIFGVTIGTQGIFWVGYFFIILLTTTILFAIIFKPRATKYVLLQIFRLPVLRRWRYRIIGIGNDIITTSEELRGKSWKYWINPVIATYLSWTARYAVVNFMIMAFTTATWSEHLLIYARQLIMWVIMLISPTPGSSGVAELAFSGFLDEFIPIGLTGALAILWRLISYYPYLFIGAIILPKWLRSTSWAKRDKED